MCVTKRASITYTRYDSRAPARAHLRIADMQSATGAMYVNARRTINTGCPLRGGVRTSHPCSSFPFVSLSFVFLLSFFFLFFCFRSFVSKCVDAIPRAGRTEKGRGQRVGREKGGLHEEYLTNFTLTCACARACTCYHRERDKQKSERCAQCERRNTRILTGDKDPRRVTH